MKKFGIWFAWRLPFTIAAVVLSYIFIHGYDQRLTEAQVMFIASFAFTLSLFVDMVIYAIQDVYSNKGGK